MRKYGKVLIGSLLAVLLATPVLAKDLKFSWSYTSEEQAKITHFMLRETDGLQYTDLKQVPAGDRVVSITAPTDGECHTYYLVASNGSVNSKPSDTAGYCDEEVPANMDRPTRITGTIKLDVVLE